MSVVFGEFTVDAIRATEANNSVLDMSGEQGNGICSVRVNKAEMTIEPGRGALITVDGNEVFVRGVRNDALGALMVIDYQKTRPFTGE